MEHCIRLVRASGLSLDTYNITRVRYPADVGTPEAQGEVWESSLGLGNQWLSVSHWDNESGEFCI